MKWKMFFLTMLAVCAPAAPVFGQGATGWNIYAKPNTYWFSGHVGKDIPLNWMRAVDPMIGSGTGLSGTNSRYYVDSNVTTEGNGTSWATAKDTIDEGYNLCSAGDFLLVAEGHTDTKSTTGALLTADTDGVTIIGYGIGSKRPQLLLSHTGATIDITADNVRFSNFYIDATGVDSVNAPINISGIGVVFDGCFVRLADTNGQADVGITIGVADGDANDVIIANTRFIAPDGGAASAITFAKDMENVILSNLYIYGDFSTAGVEVPSGGNAQENLTIEYCTIVSKNADEPAIENNGTGNTGAIVGCILVSDAEATILDAGGLSVSVDTQLVVIGNGEGAALPADMTLVDLLGDFTGPDDGSAQDDNVKASLDLVNTDTELIVADTAALEQSGEYCVTKSLTSIVNGNNDLFVVANGPIKIIEIIGIVTTTPIEAKSCLINYNMDPTTPAGDTVFGTDGTALEINADTVGALYTWDGVVANDLTATDNGVALGIGGASLIVPAGSLELAVVVATGATGQIDFFLRYKPMTPGATVTAAP